MNYRDIVPSYAEYVRLQTTQYQSFEGEVDRWRDPQLEAINTWFPSLDRDRVILDCACGDGIGLARLYELGFRQAQGVEFAPQKVAVARARGAGVVWEADMHHLPLGSGSFDVVYSSHSLEHAYEPLRVLAEFGRILTPGGQLFLILPYPDEGVVEAHGGKFALQTGQEDNLVGLTEVLGTAGFLVSAWERGYRDGPEVRLQAVYQPI